ncbi:ABC transporter, solute-binding protein [Streptomyces davaonensis JCM 4913]|uniref:ABC transporter, solute-binding protein n=1 Tax=Streptomyces davaonensis (strain DSM 101723 / JCM 4913 / KCC S-0913 / 768) TaxID=1214101 RepID=K4REV8_STRDJ|nr:ABC transporter substrate-binding protein [Streptomyces davaonensis]CCK32152.1 ABC transporter, solute-binding protein [Streptomyces davaonensis JCM 4913]
MPFRIGIRPIPSGVGTLSLGTALLLAALGCTSTKTSDGRQSDGAVITIGTTDQVTSLDPAGAWNAGSGAVASEIYATLLSAKNGSSEVTPDLASGIEPTGAKEYTVTLKPGLTFANGHQLTASDVKFSFDRMLRIADPGGPSPLLYNLSSVAAPTPTTVVFTLKSAGDTLFPQVLSTTAAFIVDEQVFPADKLLDDRAVVAGKPWNGPYGIATYDKNSLIAFTTNTAYQGPLGTPKTKSVRLKYYTDAANMKLDIQQGALDAVHRTLGTADLNDLSTKKGIQVHTGSGNDVRYLVFGLKTQPYGSGTKNPDEVKALAVRQAVADSIDRAQLAQQVYKNSYRPLYTSVPDGLPGAAPSFKSLYGDKKGGPDKAAAAARLKAAKVSTPVTLNLQYNTDHYGTSSADEYTLIKTQLEATGLFTVKLQSTEWTRYNKDLVAGRYPLYQLGWHADYLDADNYLSPFYAGAGQYRDPAVRDLIAQEQTETDSAKRTALLKQVQDKAAASAPLIPLLQGSTPIVTRTSLSGVPAELDATYQFRWAELAKK